ncbi:MAG: flagellar basal body rod protein FlgB [Pseudomonadota bacterium]|nr:flagellar basal body rod protein FlgB [Pseudomonadota bacterium]
MTIRFDQALEPHARALLLRGGRAEILAANLANADTPNYLAQDLDFQAVLAGVQGQGRLAATDPAHRQAPGGNAGDVLYRVPTQPAIDGNTVDADVEKAAFAANALRYQASLQLLGGRIKGLLAAIRGE